jgi:hypothetical protein
MAQGKIWKARDKRKAEPRLGLFFYVQVDRDHTGRFRSGGYFLAMGRLSMHTPGMIWGEQTGKAATPGLSWPYSIF